MVESLANDIMVELNLAYCCIGLSINKLTQPVTFESSTSEHSDSCGILSLDLSDNKRIGRECSDGIAFLSRFKKLRKLNLICNGIFLQGANVLTDYVLYSDSCHVLEYLNLIDISISNNNMTSIALKLLHHDKIKVIYLCRNLPFLYSSFVSLSNLRLSCDEIIGFAREFQVMQDSNYNQNFFPTLDIDMSGILMDTQTIMAVLRELKNCNRVKGANIRHTGIFYSKNTETELKIAFEHVKTHRCIIMNDIFSYATTIEIPPQLTKDSF